MSDSSSSEEEKPKKPTSAFTAASRSKQLQPSSSSSESESSESGSSSEEETKNKGASAQAKQKASKFHDSDDESDDEDGGVRVVLSAKEKAWEQLSLGFKELKAPVLSGDWTQAKDAFEKLNKTLAKFVKRGEPTPEPYLDAMLWFEQRVAALGADKDAQKKLSAARYKAFSALNSKLGKFLAPYQAEMKQRQVKLDQIAAERKQVADEEEDATTTTSGSSSSSGSSTESSESESSSSESDSSTDSSDSSEETTSSSSEEEDSDDSDASSTTSSSSSSDDEEEDNKPKGRDKWLKKSVLEARKKDSKQQGEKPEKEQAAAAAAAAAPTETAEEKRRKKLELEEQDRAKKLAEEEQRRALEATIVLSYEDVERLLIATSSKLWAKNVNRRELVSLLRQHVVRAEKFGPKLLLPALMYLVSCQFDQKSIDECMSLERWRSAMRDMQRICNILDEHPELELQPMPLLDEDTLAAVMDTGNTASEAVTAILGECLRASQGDGAAVLARERANKALRAAREENSAPNAVYVMGDLATYVARLHGELVKALKVTPTHSEEFAQRQLDESTLMFALSQSVQNYLTRRGDGPGAAKQALLQIELLYFKNEEFGDKIAERVQVILQPGYGELPAQYRALLMQIYHHALHDRYHEARDMLLQSHLASTMSDNSEPDLVLLVNRCLVQLGLSAFRRGLFREAHSLLADICSQGKAKELLAQGIVWRKPYERDEARDNVERRRLLPVHMHIDLELIECMHLTSAMLLEIASQQQYSQAGEDEQQQQQWVISRTFRRYLDSYERSIFTGPPENVRDHIMASALALREGDWQTCIQHVLPLKVWDSQPAHVKDMLAQRIKQDALKVYLVSFASCYESLSVDSLCEMFDLGPSKVKQILAKLLLSQKSTLAGSFEEDNLVRLRRVVPTTLQSLSLQLSDKTREMVESNERMMERLTGAGSGGGGAGGAGGGGEKGEEKRFYNKGPSGGGSGGGGGGGRRPTSGSSAPPQASSQQGGGGGGSRLVEQGFRPDRSSAPTRKW